MPQPIFRAWYLDVLNFIRFAGPIKVPPDGILCLQHVDHTVITQLGVVSQRAEDALDPMVHLHSNTL